MCSGYPLLLYNRIAANTLIPIHYNAANEANGWGGRSNLWISSLIGLALYIGFSVVQRYPKAINYPCKVTAENADYLHKMGVKLIRHIKVFSMLLLAYGNYSAYAAAVMGKDADLSNFVMIPLMGGMFLSLIIYFGRMMVYK